MGAAVWNDDLADGRNCLAIKREAELDLHGEAKGSEAIDCSSRGAGRRPTQFGPMSQLESIDETRADIRKQHHDLVFDRLAFGGVFGC